MNGDIVRVVARITARPDTVGTLKTVLLALIEPTSREKGCTAYRLLQNNADPTDFTFIEEWESDAAMDAHLAGPHVQAALSQVPALLAKAPDIQKHTLLG